jgi:tetratricopeptide (TPR) repeat protein
MFELASHLSLKGISAKRNLEFNKDLKAGMAPSVQSQKSVEDDFRKGPNGRQLLPDGGLFDEPTHRFTQARIFSQGQLYHQTVQQVERITELVPDYLYARLILATFYVNLGRPEKALAMLPEIRAHAEATLDPDIGKYDILQIETRALFAANRTQEAERILWEHMEKHPKDLELLGIVFQISAIYKSYSNAFLAADQALEIRPDDSNLLANKGYLAVQAGDFPTAISALSLALLSDTNNVATKLNRAISYLGVGQLEEAKQDYISLEKLVPNAYPIYYGLGEIAWRQKDTNAAIQYYDHYLRIAGDTTEEGKTISERLKSLKAASP